MRSGVRGGVRMYSNTMLQSIKELGVNFEIFAEKSRCISVWADA